MSESTLGTTGDSGLDDVAAAILALDTPDSDAPSEGKELPAESEVSAKATEADESQSEGEDPTGESEGESPDDEAEPEEKADDGEAQEPPITSIDELVKALDVDPSAVMGMKLKTKIDGEDGEVSLAELVKSYQIEGHLTRKGQKLSEERTAFERSRQEAEAGIRQRAEQLEVQLQLANKKLLGEYGAINWDALRQQNPSLYQQKYIEYQQLYGELAQAAQAISQEKQRERAAVAEKHREFLAEQKRLLHNAVPEWNDRKVKDSELQDIREYMKSRNIDPAELDLVQHHGYALVLRDAKNWQKLQQESKTVKKKIVDAPKIVRPGVRKPPGQVTSDKLKALRDRVRQSGHVNDVAAYILAND